MSSSPAQGQAWGGSCGSQLIYHHLDPSTCLCWHGRLHVNQALLSMVIHHSSLITKVNLGETKASSPFPLSCGNGRDRCPAEIILAAVEAIHIRNGWVAILIVLLRPYYTGAACLYGRKKPQLSHLAGLGHRSHCHIMLSSAVGSYLPLEETLVTTCRNIVTQSHLLTVNSVTVCFFLLMLMLFFFFFF